MYKKKLSLGLNTNDNEKDENGINIVEVKDGGKTIDNKQSDFLERIKNISLKENVIIEIKSYFESQNKESDKSYEW